ncbi:MAG: aminodeoxychorismate synthase, component I, partial [Steroidobacteraceae bacterium]
MQLQLPRDALRRLALRHPQRYPVLFDTTATGALANRSMLAACPQAALWRTGDLRLHSRGIGSHPGDGFLHTLDRHWKRERRPGTGDGFTGGWVVFLGYEIAAEIEPHLAPPRTGAPERIDAFALRCPAVLVRDELSGNAQIIIEPGAPPGIEEQVRADLAALDTPVAPTPWPKWHIEEEDPALYLERVRRAQEYIRAGDI